MIVRSILKKWYFYLLYFILIVVTPVVHAKCGVVSGEMIDFASAEKYSEFYHMLAVFLVFFILHGLLLFFMQSLRAVIVSFWRKDVKNEMFTKIINSEGSVLLGSDTGKYIASFSNDITILESRYFEAILLSIEAVFSIVTALVAIVTLNKKMMLVILCSEVLSILICLFIRVYSMKKNMIYIEKLANFTQKVKEYFSSFFAIKNYSVERQIISRFDFFNNETETAKEDADSSIAYVDVISRTSNSLVKFLIVGFGAVLVMNGEITIGIIFTAYTFTDQLVSPMHTFISQINSIGSVKSIVKRIKKIAVLSSDIECSENAGNSKGFISFENVSVERKGVKILDNVSLDFEKGKKYLIIGRNGAGKSTMLKLLKKQSDDYSGNISVSGRNIRSISRNVLAECIGYMNESVSLFCDTVRNNITLYRDISEEELQSAIKKAGLTVEPERVISDGERNISSGEMRRIEIARLIVDKPDVIICDEVVSTLDVKTAENVESSLVSMDDGTVIFVSHNFSNRLVSQYDEIILMEKGQIKAKGTHYSLMESNEYYQRLMEIKNGT